MEKSNPFLSKVCEGPIQVMPSATRRETHEAATPKVRPVELKGMDLVPLSQLMARHDPQWGSGA